MYMRVRARVLSPSYTLTALTSFLVLMIGPETTLAAGKCFLDTPFGLQASSRASTIPGDGTSSRLRRLRKRRRTPSARAGQHRHRGVGRHPTARCDCHRPRWIGAAPSSRRHISSRSSTARLAISPNGGPIPSRRRGNTRGRNAGRETNHHLGLPWGPAVLGKPRPFSGSRPPRPIPQKKRTVVNLSQAIRSALTGTFMKVCAAPLGQIIRAANRLGLAVDLITIYPKPMPFHGPTKDTP